MSALLNAYLLSSLTGSIVILVYLIMRRTLPHASGLWWREIIRCVLIVHLLMPLSITSPTSLYAITSPVTQQVLDISSSIDYITDEVALTRYETAAPNISNTVKASPNAASNSISPMPSAPFPLKNALFAVWLTGSAVMLALMLKGAWRTHSHAGAALVTDPYHTAVLREAAHRMGLKDIPLLRLSPDGPAVRGVLRPEVLISADMLEKPVDSLYMVLLHECAHIKRHDTVILWLLALINAIHWWNPVVRWATRVMRRDMELLCDARVLRSMPRHEHHIVYGHVLIDAATNRASQLLAAASPDMKERIHLIKAFAKPKRLAAALSVAACAILAVTLLTMPPSASALNVNTPATSPSETTADTALPIENTASRMETGSIAPSDGSTLPSGQGDNKSSTASLNVNDTSPLFATPTPLPLQDNSVITAPPIEPVSSPKPSHSTLDSADSIPEYGEPLAWKDVDPLWQTGDSVKVVDYRTGRVFNATRTDNLGNAVAANGCHADFEPTTAEDTAILKKCYGGQWSWDRRPMLVYLDGIWIAASISGMPHGMETIKDNNLPGWLCMHFVDSLTNGSKTIDADHQRAVNESAGKR